MKEGWIKVFSSSDLIQVELIQATLKQNGIESHVANRPDSMFPTVGEAELYTLPDRAEIAMKLIAEMQEA